MTRETHRAPTAKQSDYIECFRHCKPGETRRVHKDICAYYLEYFNDPDCLSCPVYVQKQKRQREEIADTILR